MAIIFPVRFKGNDMIKYVFPTKQKDVDMIIKYANNHSYIQKIVIFGSAVTWKCDVNSDLDIAVCFADLNEENYSKFFKFLTRSLSSQFDLIDYRLNDNKYLKNDIDTKGVVVYDRIDQARA